MSKTARAGYRDVKVGELLTLLARDFPDNEALVYPDLGLRLTFSQLEARAREAAQGLMGLGIGKGERVALWATNVPEWVILQFALAKIGAILVTVNTALRAAELQYLLKQSESCALITIKEFKGIDYTAEIQSILPELPSATAKRISAANLPYLRNVIYLGDQAPAGMLSWNQILEIGRGAS